MPRFTRAKDLERHLMKAAAALQAETIINTQAEIGSDAVSPKDTGRFRSSWFSSESTPSNAVAPEGANSPNTDAMSLRVDPRKTYYLTNSLPYAQRLCVEDYATSKDENWFKNFHNFDVPEIQDDAARVVKRAYEL